MRVYIEKENRAQELKFSGTVKELVKKLKINPETVIVTRNEELITEDTKLSNADKVKILSIISGG